MVLGSMVDSVAASAATFYYSPKPPAKGGGDVFSEDYGQLVKAAICNNIIMIISAKTFHVCVIFVRLE